MMASLMAQHPATLMFAVKVTLLDTWSSTMATTMVAI